MDDFWWIVFDGLFLVEFFGGIFLVEFFWWFFWWIVFGELFLVDCFWLDFFVLGVFLLGEGRTTLYLSFLPCILSVSLSDSAVSQPQISEYHTPRISTPQHPCTHTLLDDAHQVMELSDMSGEHEKEVRSLLNVLNSMIH